LRAVIVVVLLWVGWFELREVNSVELLLDEALALLAEEGEVVKAGVGFWRGERVRGDVRVHGGDDGVGFGELEEGVVEPDLDLGEIERIVAQIDGLAAQVSRDAVAVVVEGEGGGLGDLALIAVKECLAKLCGVDGTGGSGGVLAEALGPSAQGRRAFEGSLASLGVELGMVDHLNPGQERFVELAEGGDRGVGEFG
jgi:hypothetical protein